MCNCGRDGTPLSLRELRGQFHLTEGPRHRCIVVPYTSAVQNEEQELRAYTLEFEDFLEGLATWPSTAIWSEEFRPYVYLTERYPWAVAAVIGPRSEVRVFARGRLQAYRDGKGWLARNRGVLVEQVGEPKMYIANPKEMWRDGISKVYDDLTESAEESPYSLALFEQLLDLGLQLSPMANREAHGGLLVYSPVEDGEMLVENVRPLDSHDPTTEGTFPDAVQRRWLRGMCLLCDSDEDTLEVDSHVAQRLVRAGGRDGALVLHGSRVRVFGFGQNLIFPPEDGDAKSQSGTKHAAGERFALYCDRTAEHRGGFALAVSSDGPMTLYYGKKSAKLYWRRTK